jgi:hypothetical protein
MTTSNEKQPAAPAPRVDDAEAVEKAITEWRERYRQLEDPDDPEVAKVGDDAVALMRRPAPRESSGLLEAAEDVLSELDIIRSSTREHFMRVHPDTHDGLRAAVLAAKEAKRGGAKGGEA